MSISFNVSGHELGVHEEEKWAPITPMIDTRHRPSDQRPSKHAAATPSRKSARWWRRHWKTANPCPWSHDVNANQLFRWRKQYRDGLLYEGHGVKLLPVEVSETRVPAVADAAGKPLSVAADGTLEVVLSNQHRLRISGSVCQQSLITILRVLS